MKLKDNINKKISQVFPIDETVDLIVERIIDDVTDMTEKSYEDEVFMKIIDRLKLFMGEE